MGYEISGDPSRIDVGRVHAWLAASYWSPDIAMQTVCRAAAGSSMVIGAYCAAGQVGYARVISDRVTFAYLCDVIVDEAHRGRGVGRAMVRFALADPEHQGLRRWMLATRDAHGVYSECGFGPEPHPEIWMTFRPGRSQGAEPCG